MYNINKLVIKALATSLAATSILSVLSTNLIYAHGDETSNNQVEESSKFTDVHSNPNSIDDVIDIKISDNETIRVGVKSNSNSNYSRVSEYVPAEKRSSAQFTGAGVSVAEIMEYKSVVEEEVRMKSAIRAKSYSETNLQGGLVDIANPDPNYGNRVITVTGQDRVILENLVFGEAGNQGFVGCALVAQAIKDMYILGGYSSVNDVRLNTGYSGSITKGTNQDAKDAVAYIFDQGGYAVKHRVLYFYAPRLVKSKFHESQNFVIEYGGHRFFDRWK